MAHGSLDPSIVAALFWDGAGEFGGHQRGGGAPYDGSYKDEQYGNAGTERDDWFKTKRTATYTEINGSNERPNSEGPLHCR